MFDRPEPSKLFQPQADSLSGTESFPFDDDQSTDDRSITYDFRSLTEDELYVRLLLPTRNGYPLWQPRVDENLPLECRQHGVRIGDVGTLDEFGGFNYLFNIYHPAGDPINAQRVPPHFTQLEIDSSDISRASQAFRRGSHIASNSSQFHKTRKSSPCTLAWLTSGVPRQVGGGLAYTSPSSKGALLILPEGGGRMDLRLRQRTELYNYATEFARSWYDYINGPKLARGVHTGDIYLITGCDKARVWGTACFANPSGEMSVDFEPLITPGRLFQRTPRYMFSSVAYAATSTSAEESQTGCIFLRGFKIAVRETDMSGEQEMGIGHIRPKTFHPSDVINDWILYSYSEVDVAITHDDDWAFVVQDEEEVFPTDQELIYRISQYLEIVKLGSLTYARFNLPER